MSAYRFIPINSTHHNTEITARGAIRYTWSKEFYIGCKWQVRDPEKLRACLEAGAWQTRRSVEVSRP